MKPGETGNAPVKVPAEISIVSTAEPQETDSENRVFFLFPFVINPGSMKIGLRAILKQRPDGVKQKGLSEASGP